MDGIIGMLHGKVGIFLMFFAATFILERLFPAARPGVAAALGRMADRLRRLSKNLAFAGLNAAASPLIVIPVSAAAAQWSLDWRPDWFTGGAALAVDLALLDLWIYWWHRANHRLPFLWRFHEVHHLDQFLDSTSALRFHVGEVVLSALARAGIILVLAVPLASVVVFELLLLLATVFHHSNLRLPPSFERLLSAIIVTPAIHWVHHHALRRDTDSNYSTILSVWDPVFASRSATRRTPDLKIGVEREHDRPFLALLLRPFQQKNLSESP
jgi:sterol desaturase/sphingolipid hydroxylase (fatty acid hydroxylase superfamily)